MEEQIWNYIDGTCTDAEKLQFEKSLASDVVLQKKYDELLQLNSMFSQTELEEPSMRFSMNVMDIINATAAYKPLKTVVDKRIIKAIAFVFISSISILIVFMLSQVQWSFSSANAIPFRFNFEMPQIFTGTFVNSFLMIDVILGLLLLDKFLRIKKNANHLHDKI